MSLRILTHLCVKTHCSGLPITLLTPKPERNPVVTQLHLSLRLHSRAEHPVRSARQPDAIRTCAGRLNIAKGNSPTVTKNIQGLSMLAAAILASASALPAGTISGTVTPAAADSVVYVNAIPGKTFPAPAKPFSLNQKSLLFQPHVLAIPVGSTVAFLNSDTMRHNVFWPSVGGDKSQSHNLGTWPKGDTRPFKFAVAGVVPLLCNVHPEMSGFIVVTPTPYFALTDATGNFTIAGVPDGTYTVSAWHEGLKIQAKPATVAGKAKVDFTLTK
jgi:plastocyanin